MFLKLDFEMYTSAKKKEPVLVGLNPSLPKLKTPSKMDISHKTKTLHSRFVVFQWVMF